MGNCYWWHADGEANLRVYKEDPDEETWELVAKNKEELLELIGQLKTGNTFVRKEIQEAEAKADSVEEEEDEDSLQGLENIILDTGPVPLTSEDVSNVTSVAPSANNSDDDTAGNGKSYNGRLEFKEAVVATKIEQEESPKKSRRRKSSKRILKRNSTRTLKLNLRKILKMRVPKMKLKRIPK